MSKLRAARRLVWLRERRRDEAAAALGGGERRKAAAAASLEASRVALEQLDDSFGERLSGGAEARFEQLAWERTSATEDVKDRRTDVERATKEVEQARRLLGQREREFRTSEMIRDKLRAERDRELARREQSAADDLAAARLLRLRRQR